MRYLTNRHDDLDATTTHDVPQTSTHASHWLARERIGYLWQWQICVRPCTLTRLPHCFLFPSAFSSFFLFVFLTLTHAQEPTAMPPPRPTQVKIEDGVKPELGTTGPAVSVALREKLMALQQRKENNPRKRKVIGSTVKHESSESGDDVKPEPATAGPAVSVASRVKLMALQQRKANKPRKKVNASTVRDEKPRLGVKAPHVRAKEGEYVSRNGIGRAVNPKFHKPRGGVRKTEEQKREAAEKKEKEGRELIRELEAQVESGRRRTRQSVKEKQDATAATGDE